LKILVVGSGGREHAILWKLAQSKRVEKLYCAPGNGGISQLAECVPIKVMEKEKMADFAAENQIDMTIIGPDDPLADGIVDVFQKRGLRVFGPTAAAARIEASKVFSKDLMKKYHIPTAQYEVFDNAEQAIAYIKSGTFPAVIKAEGLALGKGVIIAEDEQTAIEAVRDMMEGKKFGDAGNRVVIEEFLTGPEISVLAFCDGKTVVPMVSAQDHKRAFDNDKGLNTGGMGAFSPSKIYTKELEEECMQNIFLPTVKAMQEEDCPFTGVLYFGLMSTKNGVKVIEYNARFGDPETQPVLMRLETDLVDIFEACIDGTLDQLDIKWKDEAAVCVVMASGGYPVKYQSGYEISGLTDAEALGLTVFHAGTKLENDVFVTAGGRVLGITAMGKTLDDAISLAYRGVEKIHFKDAHYRKDIGIKK